MSCVTLYIFSLFGTFHTCGVLWAVMSGGAEHICHAWFMICHEKDYVDLMQVWRGFAAPLRCMAASAHCITPPSTRSPPGAAPATHHLLSGFTHTVARWTEFHLEQQWQLLGSLQRCKKCTLGHTVQGEQMLLVPKQGLFAAGILPPTARLLCTVINMTEQHGSLTWLVLLGQPVLEYGLRRVYFLHTLKVVCAYRVGEMQRSLQ